MPVTHPSQDGRGVQSPLVLIVDDDAKNAKLAQDVLLAAGFRTLVARTGAEAIALATDGLPGVILMDIRLPDMDGIAAARILADGARTAAIPVVALSAVGFWGDTSWLTRAGFAGCLEKPIDVESFPHQVRRFCA
jgi:two-component system, cell cycle response regulator DivK